MKYNKQVKVLRQESEGLDTWVHRLEVLELGVLILCIYLSICLSIYLSIYRLSIIYLPSLYIIYLCLCLSLPIIFLSLSLSLFCLSLCSWQMRWTWGKHSSQKGLHGHCNSLWSVIKLQANIRQHKRVQT